MRCQALSHVCRRALYAAGVGWLIVVLHTDAASGQPQAQVDGAETPPHSLSQIDTEFGEFDHHTWTIADGLPEDSVTSIVQTRDGYLWIGTRAQRRPARWHADHQGRGCRG